MEEVVSASDSADAAAIAVEHSLHGCLIIVKRAGCAVVQSEVFAALLARLPSWLLCTASKALDVRHLVSLQLVILLRIKARVVPDLIVAEPASVVGSLADRVWTPKLALSQVVLAAVVFFVSPIVICHVLDFFLLALSSLATILVSRAWDFRLVLDLSLESRGLWLRVSRSFLFFLLQLSVAALALLLLAILRYCLTVVLLLIVTGLHRDFKS